MTDPFPGCWFLAASRATYRRRRSTAAADAQPDAGAAEDANARARERKSERKRRESAECMRYQAATAHYSDGEEGKTGSCRGRCRAPSAAT